MTTRCSFEAYCQACGWQTSLGSMNTQDEFDLRDRGRIGPGPEADHLEDPPDICPECGEEALSTRWSPLD